MEEDAKALQEVAKTTKKSLETLEKFGAFLTKVFGESFQNIGGSFADWTLAFRYKNSLKIYDKLEAIHNKRRIGGKTNPIPPRYAIPLLESASLESDENLQDKWAGLIANATDPNMSFQFQKIFIQILGNLEPLDAIILDYLSQQKDIIKVDDERKPTINAESISIELKKDREEINISLSNLFRLGCIIDSWNATWGNIGIGYQGFRVNNPESNFRLSELGRALMNACTIHLSATGRT